LNVPTRIFTAFISQNQVYMKKSSVLDKVTLKYLRSLAHGLKPVVSLGKNGLTEAVTAELDGALGHHELVKVKLSETDRERLQEQLDALCKSTRATSVQQIGHTATLFRRNEKKPVIDLALAKR